MNWPYALASILLVVVLVKYIEYEGSDRQWGDGLTGWLWTLAVRNVVALEEKGAARLTTRNWRPQIFVHIPISSISAGSGRKDSIPAIPDHIKGNRSKIRNILF